MSESTEPKEQPLINYMARDYGSFKEAMLEMIRKEYPEWTDLSESDFGVVLVEAFAYMADILSYYQDRVVNEGFLSTARERKSIIEHLRLIGYELKSASAASADLYISFKINKNRTEPIVIEKGAQFSTKATKNTPSIIFEYLGPDLSLDPDNLKDDQNEKNKKYFKSGEKLKDDKSIAPFISVTEGQTIKNEILAKSNGKSNQVYRLSQPGVLPDSIELIVKDLVKNEPWQKQDYFIYSKNTDKHYICRVDEEDQVSIHFGDGLLGLIPSTNSEIMVTYRVGGGSKGNVGKNQITQITKAQVLTNLNAIATNPKQAFGGKEREDIQDAIMNAPNVFRSQQRAVTKEDIEGLALKYEGIRKVKAVKSNWNLVKLYVVPEGVGYLTDVSIKNLKDYFEDKRMLSTIIQIESPHYINISISAELKINPYYNNDVVFSMIKYALQNDVLGIEKVNFGCTIYLSKVYEAIENIEGVDSVFVSKFLKNKNLEKNIPDFPYQDKYKMDESIEVNGKITLKEFEFPVYNIDYIKLIPKRD